MAYGIDSDKLQKKLDITKNILNCNYLDIHSLPALWSSLSILRCSDTKISVLPELPEGLEELECSYLYDLHNLPKLPSTLKRLDCKECPLDDLPELPEGLEELICNRTKITCLPKLPESLQILRCSFTPLLSLPTLGHNLKRLVLNSTYVSDIPELPPNLVKFSLNRPLNSYVPSVMVYGKAKYIRLPKLPDSIESLNISNVLIHSLPNIPKNLRDIELTAEILENTFNTLPDTIQYIMCSEGDCFKCQYNSSLNRLSYSEYFIKWINERSFQRCTERTKLLKRELLIPFID
jgi:hypothetical protein